MARGQRQAAEEPWRRHHPAQAGRPDVGRRVHQPAQQRDRVQARAARQPAHFRRAEDQLHVRPLLVGERRVLDGALAGADDRQVLPGEDAEVPVLAHMADEIGRKIAVLRRSPAKGFTARGQHDVSRADHTSVVERCSEAVLTLLEGAHEASVDLHPGALHEPAPVVQEGRKRDRVFQRRSPLGVKCLDRERSVRVGEAGSTRR